MLKITDIKIRKILNSGGKDAVEVTTTLNNKFTAKASSPSAIIPGNREVNISSINEIDEDINVLNLIKKLYKLKNINQIKIDNILNESLNIVGSDICLSLSLSVARCIAKSKKISLVKYIENLSNIKSQLKAPYPLVGIFSGGVHDNLCGSIQQIFILVKRNDFEKAINIISKIYNDIEIYLKNNNYYYDLGNSSGFITKGITPKEQFDLLIKSINDNGYNNVVSIGIDVAAEHLFKNNYYKYQNKNYTKEEFFELIKDYQISYNLCFVEDPFDPSDKKNWQLFKNSFRDIDIVGDDLFATQEKYLDNEIANATIIKMNQSGTLSNTIDTIKKAKNMDMNICVSHRSYETDDTFMCDLAVAINSNYIKIGGPRRGDRITKYNRLLELTKNTR